jgi:hypothetical protein
MPEIQLGSARVGYAHFKNKKKIFADIWNELDTGGT